MADCIVIEEGRWVLVERLELVEVLMAVGRNAAARMVGAVLAKVLQNSDIVDIADTAVAGQACNFDSSVRYRLMAVDWVALERWQECKPAMLVAVVEVAWASLAVVRVLVREAASPFRLSVSCARLRLLAGLLRHPKLPREGHPSPSVHLSAST